MPSRKRNKSKAKQVSKRAGKAKISKRTAKKKSVRKPASKAKARSTRRSVSAATELKRELQSRSRRSVRSSFEAEAVAGVQQADDSDEREVQTRELPVDDVPEEYLDKE